MPRRRIPQIPIDFLGAAHRSLTSTRPAFRSAAISADAKQFPFGFVKMYDFFLELFESSAINPATAGARFRDGLWLGLSIFGPTVENDKFQKYKTLRSILEPLMWQQVGIDPDSFNLLDGIIFKTVWTCCVVRASSTAARNDFLKHRASLLQNTSLDGFGAASFEVTCACHRTRAIVALFWLTLDDMCVRVLRDIGPVYHTGEGHFLTTDTVRTFLDPTECAEQHLTWGQASRMMKWDIRDNGETSTLLSDGSDDDSSDVDTVFGDDKFMMGHSCIDVTD